MRVCVYAIAKNEAKHAARWMSSVREADSVCVLDTGSSDDTPSLLRREGATVFEERIEPWRFDAARNRALELADEDADICVSVDLDEVFLPGWRAALERAWSAGTQQAEYLYVWNFLPDGREGHVFYREQIHARHGFRWVNPVHEVLEYVGELPYRRVRAEGVRLEHYADDTKPRTQYLPLLELAVREAPEDARSRHYLGREYMFRGRYRDAIRTLREHLALPGAAWAAERCASYRFIARCEAKLGHERERLRALLHACAEAPGLREPWVELALCLYERSELDGCAAAARQALGITERGESYITEPAAWGALPWDLAAVSLWYTGRRDKALACAETAAALEPGDGRLRQNAVLMRKLLTEHA